MTVARIDIPAEKKSIASINFISALIPDLLFLEARSFPARLCNRIIASENDANFNG
jgi:hypothetical protein